MKLVFKYTGFIFMLMLLGCAEQFHSTRIHDFKDDVNIKAYKKLLGETSLAKYQIVSEYSLILYECQVENNSIIEFETVRKDSCKGDIDYVHEFSIVELFNKNISTTSYVLSSCRKNREGGKIMGAIQYYTCEVDDNFDENFKLNISNRLRVTPKCNSKFKYKDKLYRMALLVKIDRKSIEITGINFEDSNKIGGDKGIAYNLKKIIGHNLIFNKIK